MFIQYTEITSSTERIEKGVSIKSGYDSRKEKSEYDATVDRNKWHQVSSTTLSYETVASKYGNID